MNDGTTATPEAETDPMVLINVAMPWSIVKVMREESFQTTNGKLAPIARKWLTREYLRRTKKASKKK